MKKIHILRLGSVVAHGVEGTGSGCIDLIYSFLLQEYEMDFYSYIKINQIGKDLNEFVLKEGKNIHVNIIYPARKDFEQLSSLERNKIRLDIVHKALLRIAEHDGKLDEFTLGLIRQRILDQNFSFFFVYTTHVNKKDMDLTAEIIVHPKEDGFEFYCSIKRRGKEICRLLIYKGAPVPLFFNDFFSKGKWRVDRLIIFGKENKVEIHILHHKCEVQYVNLTSYQNHPLFELYRAGITPEDKEKAYQDWLHSLPPAIAANVRENEN